jgi:ubiquinone/menaquinone biosynthesis C-methylase UbiE
MGLTNHARVKPAEQFSVFRSVTLGLAIHSAGMKAYNHLRAAVDYVQVNGVVWLMLHSLSRLSCRFGLTGVERRLRTTTRRLELSKQLPGTNTVSRNRSNWDTYDWMEGGEEWTESEEWKQSLIAAFIDRYSNPSATTLEIGPGAGRWTVELLPRSGSLIVVDVAEAPLNLVRQRLPSASNLTLIRNDGRTLPGVADESIHFVWSFDVFVHIAPADVAAYVSEIGRVLKPGGTAVLHHFAGGEERGGWRSAMTADLMRRLVEKNGMCVRDQGTSWDRDGAFNVSRHGDVITIFGRPCD